VRSCGRDRVSPARRILAWPGRGLAAQRVENAASSRRIRGHLNQRRERCRLGSVEKIKARGRGQVAGTCQQPGCREPIERAADLVGVAPDISGEPVAGQQRAWMPVEKQQQIQFAGMPQDANGAREVVQVPAFHSHETPYAVETDDTAFFSIPKCSAIGMLGSGRGPHGVPVDPANSAAIAP
jgi:hypothetical protein